MGLDEPCSPSESVDVEPQQDAVQGDEAEQQQKDDSPAESDDEPDAPQPVRPRDARTGRFGLARDTMDPELLGSRDRVGACESGFRKCGPSGESSRVRGATVYGGYGLCYVVK